MDSLFAIQINTQFILRFGRNFHISNLEGFADYKENT